MVDVEAIRWDVVKDVPTGSDEPLQHLGNDLLSVSPENQPFR